KGNVTVNPANGDPYSLVISATLTVGATSQITAAPQALYFSFQTGQAAPAAQNLVLNAIGPNVGFTVSTVLFGSNPASCGNANWLSATPQTSPLTTPNLLVVAVNTSGMTPGSPCQGYIKITYASGQGNVDLIVPVSLFVSTTPLLNIGLPQGFGLESATVASSSTITRQISVTSTDGTSNLQYQVGFQSTPCAWLLAAPITGGSSASSPTSVQVTILPSCITTPGTYQGSITITSSALPAPVTQNITLIATSNVQV